MKLVTYTYKNTISRLGAIHDEYVVDLEKIFKDSTNLSIYSFIDRDKDYIQKYNSTNLDNYKIPLSEVILCSPIQNPTSLRDAYAFRQHVEAGRKNRGLSMIPEYDMSPVFYYCNHNSIEGPGEVSIQKDQAVKLDYELEIAAIIGRIGKNIKVGDADDYIVGYTIMNDFSARKLQMEEMKLNLGPAKGKDFLTTLGPCIVTKDELSNCLIKSDEGERYNLNMKAYLNGELISQDNFKNITWTFAQIISHISNSVEIYPGDVIGSGTCATGCLLELNLTNSTDIWLKDGDEIILEVDKIGKLINTIKFI